MYVEGKKLRTATYLISALAFCSTTSEIGLLPYVFPSEVRPCISSTSLPFLKKASF